VVLEMRNAVNPHLQYYKYPACRKEKESILSNNQNQFTFLENASKMFAVRYSTKCRTVYHV
ncbi:MAG TPA: hypothetical protein PK816_15570, partial [Candidatus Cloacimonadota bacterium]|nr:hypothetical protein [Candidatus Cloacimonadota bacterium]